MRAALGMTAAAVLWVACGGGGGGNNNGGGGGGGGGGAAMTATIDGQAFSGDSGASASAHVQNGVAFYAITGAHLSGTTALGITLTLYNVSTTGTYPLGVNSTDFGGVGIVSEGASSWMTPLSGVAGSVTLTTLTSSRIAGTFSFTAMGTTNASSIRSVTGGSFDMAITGTPGTVQPYQGSSMTASLGGTPWVGATITLSKGSGTYSVLGLQLATTSALSGTSVDIILNGVNGPGSYALGAANTMMVIVPGGSYSSTGNGATGSVVVTSLDANRMKGTFSATLPATIGSGNLAVTGGTFDLGLGK